MYHDHQVLSISSLPRPLSINSITVAQPDSRSPRQGLDQDTNTFHVPVPGGASILLKDAAGTSMSLNLDIDPSSGTPILSGRAMNARGDVLDVHLCSCNDPIASRHKPSLPRSPELFRHSEAYAQGSSQVHPTPARKPPSRLPSRPTPINTQVRTPLVLVQTRLCQSPSVDVEEVQQRAEAPAPRTYAEPPESPFTPTPTSVQRHSQTPSASSRSFHTPQSSLDATSPALVVPNSLGLEQPHAVPSSSPNMPPRLDTLPAQSPFTPDLDLPLVLSPSSISSLSDITSILGPLRPLPSSFSHSASEHSTHTVIPGPHPLVDVQRDAIVTESAVNRPSSRGAVSQRGNGPVPNLPRDIIHSANDDAGSETRTTSDLFTNRAMGPSTPIPSTEPDGQESQNDSATQSGTGSMIEPVSTHGASHSGDVVGRWVVNLRQNHMALTLDLSFDGFSLQDLTLSAPSAMPPNSESRRRHPHAGRPSNRPAVTDLSWPLAAPAPAESGAEQIQEPQGDGDDDGSDAETNSSQSIATFRSHPSSISALSDLPLTPIPELLHTPTRHSMMMHTVPLPTTTTTTTTPDYPPHPIYPVGRQHPASKLPSPLDGDPILAQLAHVENDVRAIRTELRNLTNEWQNVLMMPDGVAHRKVEDNCTALYRALFDLSPIIRLTWPPMRQASLDTEGGQPSAREQQSHLEQMSETGKKWYMKQHKFTTSLQRNLTRLTLLAQRVREDPDAAYRSNVLDRISQFTAKFEDIALRLKLAHHILAEQKYRARVRHAARRPVRSSEQAAAHEYHKALLTKVRNEIDEITHTLRYVGDPQ
ncbi:hypothetical protein BC827DRAFT_527653 [Russula dissimulans]|nr:hypothetical protein BC827DRAFT_527653 [Russula dissimulans]